MKLKASKRKHDDRAARLPLIGDTSADRFHGTDYQENGVDIHDDAVAKKRSTDVGTRCETGEQP